MGIPICFREWTPHPAGSPTLAAGELHLWFGPLAPEMAAGLVPSVLSPAEIERALSFRFEADRRRFVVGRVVLRLLLAAYTGQAPSEIVFTYGPQGKPTLASGNGSGLFFNLSHTTERWLLGITTVGRLGVDLELIRPMDGLEEIVARQFSPAEAAAFHLVEPAQRLPAFFAGWTRKEAFVKALGSGLAVALDSFDVTMAPKEPPELIRVEGVDTPGSRWTLLHLEPSPGYIGAACVEGRKVQTVTRTLVDVAVLAEARQDDVCCRDRLGRAISFGCTPLTGMSSYDE